MWRPNHNMQHKLPRKKKQFLLMLSVYRFVSMARYGSTGIIIWQTMNFMVFWNFFQKTIKFIVCRRMANFFPNAIFNFSFSWLRKLQDLPVETPFFTHVTCKKLDLWKCLKFVNKTSDIKSFWSCFDILLTNIGRF